MLADFCPHRELSKRSFSIPRRRKLVLFPVGLRAAGGHHRARQSRLCVRVRASRARIPDGRCPSGRECARANVFMINAWKSSPLTTAGPTSIPDGGSECAARIPGIVTSVITMARSIRRTANDFRALVCQKPLIVGFPAKRPIRKSLSKIEPHDLGKGSRNSATRGEHPNW